MLDHEATQGKRRSPELLALPKLIVPTTIVVEDVDANSSNGNVVLQPHALSVDFQYNKGEPVSPCSDVSPSSRYSVVSLSPSLFPLPPSSATPPTTAHSSIPDSPPPPCTSGSHSSISSWFSPPSPPPSTPLPPTPTQKRLASLIGLASGLESVQVPAYAKVKSPLPESPEISPAYPINDPRKPPRRLTSFTIDSQGFRESVIDPDVTLTPTPPPPRSSLPPPYSPGLCTPERFSNASVPSTRADSTTPLAYNLADYEHGRTPHSPESERERRKQRGDVEAGGTGWWARHWQSKPQKRRRKVTTTIIGAASAALLMVVAGIAVGIYLAVSGRASL
ncbi:hypothetical protein F5Y00DRAFT_249034 [Daldinia vernicosa]|uniref:uncharacterized protein n=1 Tax=Daldinia vernicosa TaxID=114800 RepID=UPI002007C884|nr:uncharacterized protein F5Y00DRAFT_249034 [Daldinia vernicosa]KAI0844303.1 hypothetical protein F5Y00DRAFT_249034 [Daldinia vernicosa]